MEIIPLFLGCIPTLQNKYFPFLLTTVLSVTYKIQVNQLRFLT